jgi:NADPH2:quinone reductase
VPLPDDIDDRTVAAVLLQGMTARFLLKEVVSLQPGQQVLVHAAAAAWAACCASWRRRCWWS